MPKVFEAERNRTFALTARCNATNRELNEHPSAWMLLLYHQQEAPIGTPCLQLLTYFSIGRKQRSYDEFRVQVRRRWHFGADC